MGRRVQLRVYNKRKLRMDNEVDDIELWLMDPDTTLEDINKIANGDDDDVS